MKNKLSSYLALVKKGEVISFTKRDEVGAELRQPSAAPFLGMSRFERFIEEELRLGTIKHASHCGAVVPLRRDGPPGSTCNAQELLQSIREEKF